MVTPTNPVAVADVPLSGLCRVQTGVKFLLPPLKPQRIQRDFHADA
jgi:hypothetical protein